MKELIIFDLGGVLLDIDYQKTQNAFRALGVSEVDDLYSQARQSSLFDELEVGAISPDTFRAGLQEILCAEFSAHVLDQAWNALLGDLPAQRLEFVESVAQRYRTCILSNTNSIHIAAFEKQIEQSIGLGRFYGAFEEIYYSSSIGYRKPHKEAFQYVLDACDVSAEQAIFIDDSIQHIEGAQAMGIEAVWLRPGEEIYEKLAYLIS